MNVLWDELKRTLDPWGLDILWWLGHIFQGISAGAAGSVSSYVPCTRAMSCWWWQVSAMNESHVISSEALFVAERSNFFPQSQTKWSLPSIRSGFAKASCAPSCGDGADHLLCVLYPWALLMLCPFFFLPILFVVFSCHPRSDGALHGLSPKASCENATVSACDARTEKLMRDARQARAGSTIFSLAKQKRSGATSSGVAIFEEWEI